jgi:nitroimidazol reductase NimA-like FMN-containing flavoprotein (pyridoxamine 5'-phosphate oxidase superfamily)
MAIEFPGTDVELSASQAWSLLRTAAVGRLAVVVDGRPEVFPVSYVVDRGSVVFRTAEGTKLHAADHRYVALEADGVDEAAGSAWSVVVRGRAYAITAVHESLDAMFLPLHPIHPRRKPIFVRIEGTQISGRWFRTPSPRGV